MRPIGDMPVLSDIEIGYFAGIIDGEGSVSIYSAGRGLLSTEISIFNTDVRMLNYLHSLLPKSQKPARMTASRKKSTSNWKRAYRLSIRRMPVIQWLLKQVLPFLRIKKEQAELLLAFIESRQKASLYHPSTEEHRYSKKDYEIVERMHMLNHRGNKPYIQTRIYPK